MKKMTILDLCLCAMMAALHIVLELYCTINIGNDLKISFSTLPFIIAGMLCGPIEGFATGLVGVFLSQLLTYGITVTTPFWVIPGAFIGLAAGLIFKAFRRKTQLVPVGVSVFAAEFVGVLLNLLASYMDGVVVYKYYTIEAFLLVIPLRIVTWVGISIICCAVVLPLCKALLKSCPAGMKKMKAQG